MASINNLVHETSLTTGTGNLTLVNVTGKQSFNSAFGTGGSNLFYYFVSNRSAAEWEVGTGHLSAAPTLVRDTVLKSSNADAAVNFSAGLMDVTCDVPAASQYYASGTDVAIADGGTGQGTAVLAFNALSPVTTRGDIIVRDATNNARLALGSSGAILHSDGTDAVYGLLDATNLTTTVPAFGFGPPINLGLAASAASSALTITLTGANGSTPSATNPVIIPFRNATETTGTPTFLSVTAAATLVISSGSTMGVTSATAFRIWIVGFNDAGTFRLGAINCMAWTSGVVNIYPLNEGALASSTAEGGAGAADSAGVIYTGTAVTTKAMRVLGYFEWSSSGLTAGTWTTTNLLRIQLMGAGVSLPGTVIQTRGIRTSTNETQTTVTPVVSTNLRATLVIQSAANIIRVVAHFILYTNSTTALAMAQMSRGTTANTNLIGTIAELVTTNNRLYSAVPLIIYDQPGTTGSLTYAVQFWTGTAGQTAGVNDGSYGQITAEEIMV